MMPFFMPTFIVNRQKISQHVARFMGMTKQRVAKGDHKKYVSKRKKKEEEPNTKRNDAETI